MHWMVVNKNLITGKAEENKWLHSAQWQVRHVSHRFDKAQRPVESRIGNPPRWRDQGELKLISSGQQDSFAKHAHSTVPIQHQPVNLRAWCGEGLMSLAPLTEKLKTIDCSWEGKANLFIGLATGRLTVL